MVHFHVLLQLLRGNKRLGTILAHLHGRPAIVCDHMALKVTGPCEELTALLAGKFLLARVNFLVPFEDIRPGELTAANAADIVFLPVMDLHVAT